MQYKLNDYHDNRIYKQTVMLLFVNLRIFTRFCRYSGYDKYLRIVMIHPQPILPIFFQAKNKYVEESVRRILSKTKIYVINITMISNDVYGDVWLQKCWLEKWLRLRKPRISETLPHDCNSFLSLQIILSNSKCVILYSILFERICSLELPSINYSIINGNNYSMPNRSEK